MLTHTDDRALVRLGWIARNVAPAAMVRARDMAHERLTLKQIAAEIVRQIKENG